MSQVKIHLKDWYLYPQCMDVECSLRDQLAALKGVQTENGLWRTYGRWAYEVRDEHGLVPEGASITPKNSIYLTDGSAAVVEETSGMITLSTHAFGKGKGIYLPSFEFSWENKVAAEHDSLCGQ
ncbi:lacto-N-biose phosphorylase central domain-containing protein [Paenibacillus polymyxa]|uniref:lacto-N-biose phosphorylase central domain-containing protein n=1 Tax=Paenibacillus polymyxa TaxID=1406 RepID=UPI002379559A|nr:lacto-N-biose phosphorylase central domain-containing protein [Paenibacillus polymyxa]